MSKPSPYKQYLNDAFTFSTAFYKTHFKALFHQCGLLKLPLDDADCKRLKSYESYMDIRWQKKEDAYFFPDAGLINPTQLIHKMLSEVIVKEHYQVQHISYHDSWHVDRFDAPILILATGSSPLAFDIPYLQTKRHGGYRYDVHFKEMQQLTTNIHRELSFSCYQDKKVIIGATFIRGDESLTEAAYHDSYKLLQKAATIKEMRDLKIIKYYTGYRISSRDYFPILGSVIDHQKTLMRYPSIKKGTRIPTDKYSLFPNLYIHTALASRGFIFAPYNASLLADMILEQKALPQYLTTQRLFRKWAQKI